jgi:hypothetical protein
MRGTTKTLLTWFAAAGLVAFVAVAHARAQHDANPFIDHGDRGEVIHVLPAPAALHNPRFDQPTDYDLINGTQVFPASYGNGPLTDHGGPEIPSAGFRAVYWNSSVANSTASSSKLPIKTVIDNFSIAFSTSPDYTIIQQYGTRNTIANTLDHGGFAIYSQSTQSRISDSGIQSFLKSLFTSGQEQVDPNTVYGVYFPSGMKVSLQGGTSCSAFCGYHSHFTYNGLLIKYAVFPYTDCRACSVSGKTVADILTIVTSHEIREAVTDSLGTAWYDSQGYEADDKCAWHNLYQMTNGSAWVQPEYSNANNGCVVPK